MHTHREIFSSPKHTADTLWPERAYLRIRVHTSQAVADKSEASLPPIRKVFHQWQHCLDLSRRSYAPTVTRSNALKMIWDRLHCADFKKVSETACRQKPSSLLKIFQRRLESIALHNATVQAHDHCERNLEYDQDAINKNPVCFRCVCEWEGGSEGRRKGEKGRRNNLKMWHLGIKCWKRK